MFTFPLVNLRALLAISLCLTVLATPLVRAQQQPPPSPTNQSSPPTQDEEVIRITTDLVQTDVMVFDREGRFVDNLTRDQFELRVDDRPREISFFEQISAGTLNEEAQIAAARGGAREGVTAVTDAGTRPLDRGRTIFFFVDDLHLSADSAIRVRRTLERFIEREIGQNDEAAIASTSGQIGFLQQLTGNKTVLRRAAERINARTRTVTDFERPRMTEYQALAIGRYDRDLTNYFIDETMRQTPGISRPTAEQAVQSRARSIVQQSVSITTATLSTLEGLVRSSSSLPGRKLVFFISDGFFLNRTESNVSDRMRRITDAAARSGTVIYSLDARGLVSGLPDASEGGQFDPSGVLSRSSIGEVRESQEVLQTLAAETGGRALINRNDLDAGITRSVRETSVYYLLAWQPEGDATRGNRFRRIEVGVRNRPDLTVRVRRGYLTQPSNAEEERSSRRRNSSNRREREDANRSPDRRLLDALLAPFPRTALPVSLSAGYLSLPANNIALVVSIGFDAESLFAGGATAEADANRRAEIDVAGAVYNDRGTVASSFRQTLTISQSAGASGQPLIYSNQFRLTAPGLYQVRVAARNRRNDVAGSTVQWIEIPDTRAAFALSSLFIGGRAAQTITASSDGSTPVQPALPPSVTLSANRRFARNSILRFLIHTYNAGRAASGTPDVALQVQIFRDDQPVFTAPLRRISTEGVTDLTRIPYAAEISLTDLPAGRYQLRITAIDRTTRASASQQTDFTIE